MSSAACLCLPTTASALPSVSVDRDCYSDQMPIQVSGTGYTPNGNVNLLFAFGGTLGTVAVTADASGTIAGMVETPEVRQRRMDVSLTANDETRLSDGTSPPEQQFALTQFLFSQWGVRTAWPASGTATAKPRQHMTVEAYGWVGSATRTLYAHYIRRGRLARTVRVGALRGPCADLRRSMRQFPFRPVPAGAYRVRFDTTRSWRSGDPDAIAFKRVVVKARHAVR